MNVPPEGRACRFSKDNESIRKLLKQEQLPRTASGQRALSFGRAFTRPRAPQYVQERRLLLVGPSPPPYNGMSVATGLMLEALGNDVRIVRLDTTDRRGISNIGKLELGNLLLAARHGFQSIWLLFSKRPSIVYVPISQAWLPFLRDCLFLIPARISGRKIIVHLHGGYFGTFYRGTSSLMRLIIRYALAKVSIAIVLGKNVRDSFDDILPPERIRIVPNGIPDHFAGLERGRKRHEELTLLYLSALDSQKGILDLLEAVSLVIKHSRPVRVTLAGEWYSQRDREHANHLIRKFGIGGYVDFVGVVGPTQKRNLLMTADVLILPSRNEGQPYAILEAMSAGLPVISTRIACIPETIRDGVDGFLVKPGDINSLAEKIGLLIRDDKLRYLMGLSARQRFLEEYTYEIFAARIRTVFLEAVADG